MAPSNDSFANAIDLGAALSGTVRGSNVAATTEVGEPAASDSGQTNPAATVWWKFTTTGSPPDYMAISTRDSTFDTVLGIYTGASVGALTEIVSNDDSGVAGGGGRSQVIFATAASTTYYIQVDGFDVGDEGDIILSWLSGPIPTPTVTEGHGTGTDAVTFSVASTGSRGVAVVVLGGNFSTTAGELDGFTVSPSGSWIRRETVNGAGGTKIGEVWVLTFDDEFVAPSYLSPTFTAVDGLANPITPGAAKIAYAWTTIAYGDAVNWHATYSTSNEDDAPTAVQVVDPDLFISTFLQTASHYVGATVLDTTTIDGSSNPIVLSASADSPLSNEAQDANDGPVSSLGTHGVQTLVGIASDVNITPVAGMSGTRTWTTAWEDGPPPYDGDGGIAGAGVIVRAYPVPIPAARGGVFVGRLVVRH